MRGGGRFLRYRSAVVRHILRPMSQGHEAQKSLSDKGRSDFRTTDGKTSGQRHVVTIARVAGTIRFPSDVLLVVAMNPCPCGFAGHATIACQCDERALMRYRRRLSGPLTDRIDLHVPVGTVPVVELDTAPRALESATLRTAVINARTRQLSRFGALNAGVNARTLTTLGHFLPDALALLRTASEQLGLSARAWHRTLRVARTIADLAAAEAVSTLAVAEALRYRRANATLAQNIPRRASA